MFFHAFFFHFLFLLDVRVCHVSQMSAMSNRTVLVDNNTWNNTHIATVGRALASSEEKAYPIMEVTFDAGLLGQRRQEGKIGIVEACVDCVSNRRFVMVSMGGSD